MQRGFIVRELKDANVAAAVGLRCSRLLDTLFEAAR
jgi:hypothetical protein